MTTLGPFGFSGGLNSNAATNTIGKDQMSDSQDVYLVEGDLVKRTGSRVLNSSAISGTPSVTGLTDWQTAAGQRYQVVTAGTKIFQTADLGSTLTDVTGAVTITSNISTFASLNNVLVRCGGTDAPISWSGTGNFAALAGSPPSGNLCYTVNNYMFISGTSANPSRVYWSNVIDPTTWPATSFFDFRASDGDKVTALAGMDQFLIVFKRNSIGKFDTTSTLVSGAPTLGPLYTSVVGKGCAGPLAWDNTPDGKIVFMAPDSHVYIYDGSSCIDISDADVGDSNIQNLLNNLVLLQNVVVRYYPAKKQIWVSATQTGSSSNNIIFIFDYIKGSWVSKYTNVLANVMAVAIDTRATINHAQVLLTGNYAGQIYEQDFGSNNPEQTNNIIDGYGTVTIQFSGAGADFIPRSLLVPIEFEGSWDIELNYGYNDFSNVTSSNLISANILGQSALDSFILDTSTLGGGGLIRRVSFVNATNKNSSMQVQFRNRYAGQTFTIHPFWISDEVEL